MPKIKILDVKNFNNTSKQGKPYISCTITTLDKFGNETQIKGFGNSTTKSWVKGQEVELEIYKEEYNGKEYLKFVEPAERSVFTELDEIKAELKSIKTMLISTKDIASALGGEVVAGTDMSPKNQDIKVEDIPF